VCEIASRLDRVPARLRRLVLASLLAGCSIDQTASLGRYAQAEPAMAGASGMPTGGAAGAALPPPGGTGGAEPPLVFDAGAPPPPPVMVDAGTPDDPPAMVPPSEGPCAAPIRYAGDFSCTLPFDPSMPFPGVPPGARPPSTMTAPIAFGLEPSVGGTLAQVVDSEFMFLAWELGSIKVRRDHSRSKRVDGICRSSVIK
jgi:hypothetical protein